jgi:prepilin-type N-terminal cleavage/methylation domain-containing protein
MERRNEMKRKGFTLVELLVVIAIIALLMGILMPALAKVKQIANRILCGSNLSAIGKAMMLYSNEFDQTYPRAGGPRSEWGSLGYITQWDALSTADAFGAESGAQATITSSFYLLIKFNEMTPKQFICNGDIRNTEFDLSNWLTDCDSLTAAYDFATQPALHCSYSMHLPYIPVDAGAPVVPASDAGAPLCADRNPYLDVQAHWLDGQDTSGRYPAEPPTWDMDLGYIDIDKCTNSQCHEREGQNVLFNDGHVDFEELPNCGIDNDNIWKYWDSLNPEQHVKELDGLFPGYGTYSDNSHVGEGLPVGPKDAYLVNEDQRAVGDPPMTPP